MNDQIERVADFIVNAKRIVIFVGAGLSTESVSWILKPWGVWDKYDPEDFYFQNFLSNEVSEKVLADGNRDV